MYQIINSSVLSYEELDRYISLTEEIGRLECKTEAKPTSYCTLKRLLIFESHLISDDDLNVLEDQKTNALSVRTKSKNLEPEINDTVDQSEHSVGQSSLFSDQFVDQPPQLHEETAVDDLRRSFTFQKLSPLTSSTVQTPTKKVDSSLPQNICEALSFPTHKSKVQELIKLFNALSVDNNGNPSHKYHNGAYGSSKILRSSPFPIPMPLPKSSLIRKSRAAPAPAKNKPVTSPTVNNPVPKPRTLIPCHSNNEIAPVPRPRNICLLAEGDICQLSVKDKALLYNKFSADMSKPHSQKIRSETERIYEELVGKWCPVSVKQRTKKLEANINLPTLSKFMHSTPLPVGWNRKNLAIASEQHSLPTEIISSCTIKMPFDIAINAANQFDISPRSKMEKDKKNASTVAAANTPPLPCEERFEAGLQKSAEMTRIDRRSLTPVKSLLPPAAAVQKPTIGHNKLPSLLGSPPLLKTTINRTSPVPRPTLDTDNVPVKDNRFKATLTITIPELEPEIQEIVDVDESMAVELVERPSPLTSTQISSPTLALRGALAPPQKISTELENVQKCIIILQMDRISLIKLERNLTFYQHKIESLTVETFSSTSGIITNIYAIVSSINDLDLLTPSEFETKLDFLNNLMHRSSAIQAKGKAHLNDLLDALAAQHLKAIVKKSIADNKLAWEKASAAVGLL